ncbi:MAG: glycosyltransferase, partial [Ruminococcus flavefaciens]|nr:glycosyltransferase [Ruminococcus flavefaciens]
MYISVIVPVYNVENYLDECVRSLVKQDFPDDQYEILLIDDGSTDCCGEKCDTYSKKYKNICSLHKENGGLSDARNFGFEATRGKYILFVDADDYIKPDCLKKLVRASKEQHEPDIVFLQAKKLLHGGKLKKYDCAMDT